MPGSPAGRLASGGVYCDDAVSRGELRESPPGVTHRAPPILRIDNGRNQVLLEPYEQNLRTMVARLKKTGATLIWCSTTPVPEYLAPA